MMRTYYAGEEVDIIRNIKLRPTESGTFEVSGAINQLQTFNPRDQMSPIEIETEEYGRSVRLALWINEVDGPEGAQTFSGVANPID